MNDERPLVQIRDLAVTYHTRLGDLSAVQGVSFDVQRGEILGLVGESGCGKSTLGKALLRMIAPPGEISGGKIIFDGEDIMEYDERRLREFRGRAASMIFQDPMTSLNPVQRIDEHVVEAMQVHERQTVRDSALERVRGLAERLGIEPPTGGLSPPALGRDAPARHDRPRAGAQRQPHRGRRGYHIAGRHRRGQAAGPAARGARRLWRHHPDDHPQHRVGGRRWPTGWR